MELILSKYSIKVMIDIIQSDIDLSEFNQPCYEDVEEMRYYADRAYLMETLKIQLGAEQ